LSQWIEERKADLAGDGNRVRLLLRAYKDWVYRTKAKAEMCVPSEAGMKHSKVTPFSRAKGVAAVCVYYCSTYYKANRWF